MPTLLVTGASGQLGRRVLQLLLDKKSGPIIATTRTPASLADFAAKGVEVREASFDQPESLATAFKGADRALLISTDALDRPGHRLEQHLATIKALAAAGVKHVVYTSLTRPEDSVVTIAPDHQKTEEALAASTLDFTILRNNMYIDLALGVFAAAVASGQLVDARAKGKIGFVTREDCAQAAAAALSATTTGRTTLEITGPESLSSDQIAAALSDITGKQVGHVAVPFAAAIEGMVKHGLPQPVAEMMASFDAACEKGQLDLATDAVKQLTGRAPQSVNEFLKANRAALGA